MTEGTFWALAILLLLGSCTINSAIKTNYEGKAEVARANNCNPTKE